MSTWKLFYDGGCNLCHASQLRAERWAQKAGQPLAVDVLASDEAIAKGYGEAMVLEADGEVLTADAAWMKLSTIGPFYVKWLPMLYRIGVGRALLKWGYNLVAKYRIRVFGSRQCALPAPKKP